MYSNLPALVPGHTWHGRKGKVQNAFRYGVDYVLVDAEAAAARHGLFVRNGRGFAALHDRDHGGEPGQGRGAEWVREVLAIHDQPTPARILLLTQPRILGHVFNPVSFWLCLDAADDLRAVIAEVTNTFGDRHSYLCANGDDPITADTDTFATKILHVSPFQPQTGRYRFRFDLRPDRIGVRIDYDREGGGLVATLVGDLRPMTNAGLIRAFLRRPFGSRRVLTLIHWQALKLWVKRARYRTRPAPPATQTSHEGTH